MLTIEDTIKNLETMRMWFDRRDLKSIPMQTIDMAIKILKEHLEQNDK